MCLALRCEKIEEQKWVRPIVNAAIFGGFAAAIKMGLDYVTDWILIDNWRYSKIFSVSGAINGIFAFFMLIVLFAIVVKGKVYWSLQTAKPLAGMVATVLLYVWAKNSSWWYDDHHDISTNVWTFALFMVFLWWLLNVLHDEKKRGSKKVSRWINGGILLGQAALLVLLIDWADDERIHLPVQLTYPYETVIRHGHAGILAYVSEENEVEVPEKILWADVGEIDGEIYSDLGTDLIVRDVPEGVEVYRLYHKESQSYITITYDSRVYIDKYVGNEEKVEIPGEVWGRQVTGISEGCFQESSVKEVVIPETVYIIMRSAFEGCKSLKQVTLPSQLESISMGVFKDSGIEKIVLPESVKAIGTDAFKFSEIKEVIGLENVEYIGNSAFRGTPLEEGIEGDFVCIGDVLCLYRGDKEEVVIPSNVKEIRGAFAVEEEYPYPKNVKKVFIPESVTTISGSSFSGQKGIEVYVPETVTSLGQSVSASIFGYEVGYRGYENIIVTTKDSPAVAHAIKGEEGRFRIITKEKMQQEMEKAISGRDEKPEEEVLNVPGIKWLSEYIDMLSGDKFIYDEYALIYIDEDQIPELVGNNIYKSYRICTCSEGEEAECYSDMPYAALGGEYHYWPYKDSVIYTYTEEDGTGHREIAYGMTEETRYTELNENYISFYDIDFCSKDEMLEKLHQCYRTNAGRPYDQDTAGEEETQEDPVARIGRGEEDIEEEKLVALKEVEGYEYLRQLDLASADGNVYPVMVPKDFLIETGDRFVIYFGNGFELSMYARELFDGETLTDFMDDIGDFIYEEPDGGYINVKNSGQIEKDGRIYQICTADREPSDGTIYPNVQLIAAIPLGGTDVLSFKLTFDEYSANPQSIKYFEEIEKYYKVPVAEFIGLLESEFEQNVY